MTIASGLTRMPLVNEGNFLLATRESGYRSTPSAIAELVDNAIEAAAGTIEIRVTHDGEGPNPIRIAVEDDGRGMDEETLQLALQFGGSTRFGKRDSLGRFGMGLPNSSLSRARHVRVTSRYRGEIRQAEINLDTEPLVDLRTQTLDDVGSEPKTGTKVELLNCDRLEHRRTSTITKHLTVELGRVFRRFISSGLVIRVNGETLDAVDPMHLDDSADGGARLFGEPLEYWLPSNSSEPGKVTVRFAELPLERMHQLPNDEKRRRRITGWPPVSVLRCGREVTNGWYFMGAKRRENYDDWWRCEIDFDPVLDEHFGLTHTKQAIRPTEYLTQTLSADLEPVARALNSRTRRRFDALKIRPALSAAEKAATKADALLPRLPDRRRGSYPERPTPLAASATNEMGGRGYEIVVAELASTSAYEFALENRRLTLCLNIRHPLVRSLVDPERTDGFTPSLSDLGTKVTLQLLAQARVEAAMSSPDRRRQAAQFRHAWSNIASAFSAET